MFLAAVMVLSAQAADRTGVFLPRMYRDVSGQTPYRLYIPVGYKPGQSYPLVVWLHGSGARGVDNQRQISSANRTGSRFWAKPENQKRHPCFVLVPQTSDDWLQSESWEPSAALERVVAIIAALQKEFSLDASRIYVAGQSMGGYGTWTLVSAHPEMFAAAVPLCGGGDVFKADRIAGLPLWAFHGDRDTAVPVEQSRRMIEALRQAGGKPRYSEYKGSGHEIWGRVFKEPELLDWVFAQKRKQESR